MTRETVRGAISLLAVFVAGAASGVAADRIRSGEPPAGARVTQGTPEMLSRLGLTSMQRHAADSILELRNPESEAVMRDVVSRLAAVADSVKADLKQILTPAQRIMLDSMTGSSVFLLKRKGPDGATRVDTVLKR